MNKAQRKYELISRIRDLGFTYQEAQALRRIEMTLQRWAEMECGDSNDFASFSIERDETTGKPFCCVYPHNGPMRRYPVADREKGALKRLAALVSARNERETAHEKTLPIENTGKTYVEAVKACTVIPFHQTDPRGCALYLLKASDIPAGSSIDSIYNRGLAICA